jgi:hypothetical protein
MSPRIAALVVALAVALASLLSACGSEQSEPTKPHDPPPMKPVSDPEPEPGADELLTSRVDPAVADYLIGRPVVSATQQAQSDPLDALDSPDDFPGAAKAVGEDIYEPNYGKVRIGIYENAEAAKRDYDALIADRAEGTVETPLLPQGVCWNEDDEEEEDPHNHCATLSQNVIVHVWDETEGPQFQANMVLGAFALLNEASSAAAG